MRIAWFNCFAGIAGDMALASLLDAGADISDVRGLLEQLPIDGWDMAASPVLRGGIASTLVTVTVSDQVTERSYGDVVDIVRGAGLPARAEGRALAVFEALARSEAIVHRCDIEQVHFHEAGAHDAVVDIVGTAAALEVLDVAEVCSSPVALGSGVIESRHGLLPNPAPAVVALLCGGRSYGRPVDAELTTPTGAALLAGMSSGFGAMPPMRITSAGYGAGSRDLEGLPNCTQVLIGEREDDLGAIPHGAHLEGMAGFLTGGTVEPLVLLETNLDDATGEVLAYSLSALLEAGALDAWISPVVMKKGRPGHVLSALASQWSVADVVGVMLAESGSFGVRSTQVSRWAATRDTESVEVGGCPVRVKATAGRAKAEQADAAQAAARLGLPMREVIAMAEESWKERHGRQGVPGGSGQREL